MVFKLGKRFLARVLAFVAVDGRGAHARAGQVPHDAVGAVLRARKDERRADARVLEHPLEQLRFLLAVDEIDRLLDLFDGRGRRRGAHMDRVLQNLVDEGLNRLGNRRAEHEVLPLLREFLEHAADIGQKAHIEHAVRLVEDENFNPRQIDEALVIQVIEPPGRRDEDIDAGFQRRDLRPLLDAAEEHARVKGKALSQGAEVFENLQRELPRRRQHEGARRFPPPGLLRKQRQDRHGKRRGLAGSRLRAAEQVAPREHLRDGFLLDRRRGLIALGLYILQQPRLQGHLFKSHTFSLFSSVLTNFKKQKIFPYLFSIFFMICS